jgi:hypothetical protein
MVAALRSEFGPLDQSMHEKLLFQHQRNMISYVKQMQLS